MKYVMFTNAKTGLRLPVLSAEYATHADLRMGIGWIPTSAGFVQLGGHESPTTRLASCFRFSESLKLAPAEDDAQIIDIIIAGMESAIFLVQDTDENLRKLQYLLRERKQAK